jgi:hypothetical protein
MFFGYFEYYLHGSAESLIRVITKTSKRFPHLINMSNLEFRMTRVKLDSLVSLRGLTFEYHDIDSFQKRCLWCSSGISSNSYKSYDFLSFSKSQCFENINRI